jgi:hypothetical protein
MAADLVLYGSLRSVAMTQVTLPSIAAYLVRRHAFAKVVASVDGAATAFPFAAERRVLAALPRNASAAARYARALDHVLYGLSRCTAPLAVVARVDVEFAGPVEGLPRNNATMVVRVPAFQHWGGVNDRFAAGATPTLRRWFARRRASCAAGRFAERAACEALRAEGLRAEALPHVRFVRRRADVFVPDVDKATVWRSMPLRPWMLGHARHCDRVMP